MDVIDPEYPIMNIFSDGADDSMVAALRDAMRKLGATPRDEQLSSSKLPVGGHEFWERADGNYQLTNRDVAVLLEAHPRMLDEVKGLVRSTRYPDDDDGEEVTSSGEGG